MKEVEPKDQQLMVALRIRPLSDTELEEGATITAHKVGDQMVVLMHPGEDPEDTLRAHRPRDKTFIFDAVFDQHASQEDVYRATTQHLVEGVVSGYNATVFAYGPSGAGKTYTMLGMDAEPGIYLQTLTDLFRAIEESRDNADCSVSMSYLEIYNEVIRDLLNPSSGFLDLREDSRGSIQIAGIMEVSTSNAQEIMQLLTKGNRQRTQEPTAAKRTSSRSHAVLQVTVQRRSRGTDMLEGVHVGRLFLVDLAGSERASQTQNRGKRRKEGAHINRSLLALGNCINALSEKSGSRAQYVNFRDSKLTRLLKDALGGNSLTVMIAHISPASTSFEESRTTLLYAYRAKNIKTRVKRNLLNVSYRIAQYMDVISDLRREIERLKSKIETQETEKRREPGVRDARVMTPPHDGVEDSRLQMNKIRAQLIGAFKEQLEMRHSLMELENTNIELHIDTSRHLLTIADWEREKTHQHAHSDGTPERDEEPAETDVDGDESESAEPHEVALAREEVNMLLAEQRKTAAIKEELSRDGTWADRRVHALPASDGHRGPQGAAGGSAQQGRPRLESHWVRTVVPVCRCLFRLVEEASDEVTLLMAGLEQRLANAKRKALQLEKLLPTQVISEDQREVLRLLCWAHELELENTELQASRLRRRHLLCQKDFVIQRHHQHRQLCEQLIHDLWQLIQDGGIPVPEALDRRFRRYSRELGEGSLNRLLLLHSVMSSSLQDGSVLNLSPPPPDEAGHDQPDDRKDLPWGAQFELPRMLLQTDRLPPCHGGRRPSRLQVESLGHPRFCPAGHHFGGSCGPLRSDKDSGLTRPPSSSLSMKNLVSKVCPPTGLDLGRSQMAVEASGPALSAQALKEMAMSTKSIALIAATRRSKAQDREGGSGHSSLHLPEEVALDSRDPKASVTPEPSPGSDGSAKRKARRKWSPSLTWSAQPVVEPVAESQPPPALLQLTKSSGKSFFPAVPMASKIKPSLSVHAGHVWVKEGVRPRAVATDFEDRGNVLCLAARAGAPVPLPLGLAVCLEEEHTCPRQVYKEALQVAGVDQGSRIAVSGSGVAGPALRPEVCGVWVCSVEPRPCGHLNGRRTAVTEWTAEGLACSGHFLLTDAHDVRLWVWLLVRGIPGLWQHQSSRSVTADEKMPPVPEVSFTLPSATWQSAPGLSKAPILPRDIRGSTDSGGRHHSPLPPSAPRKPRGSAKRPRRPHCLANPLQREGRGWDVRALLKDASGGASGLIWVIPSRSGTSQRAADTVPNDREPAVEAVNPGTKVLTSQQDRKVREAPRTVPGAPGRHLLWICF
ncbi:PREDICTED: kinesin-like protein KIF19 [Odobenus rosmarus divergens]|uniref:Kinesin-like protein KIF19 n=1 Tax=Odobenus rosmarus divergens TaxID=9708 RepID=A0A2U3VHH9_ODORO|nr:PREDICTED: kinesin-like protein KIF19 [Odobenus rosmarus divergens]